MRKQYYFLVLLVLWVSSISKAQWTALDKSSFPGSKAEVRLITDTPSETIIKVDLPGFLIKEFNSSGKVYHDISFSEEAIISETGAPQLPYIAKVLAIPDNCTVEVEVLENGHVQTFQGINVPPARESGIEGTPETPYLEEPAYYNSKSLYPTVSVKAGVPAIFRDFRIARIAIFPLRYSPEKHELSAVSSMTVRIRYIPGSGINPRTSPHHPIAPSFGKLYRSFIFNYSQVLQRDYDGMEVGEEHLLCIIPDEYVPTFQTYSDWKQKSGVRVTITKFSEIGANPNDPNIIRDHIQFAYQNWLIPPTHVLIVGDQGTAPVKFITSLGWNFVTEDFFVELEGNDYFPEVFIGRFTNENDYTLQVLTSKAMNYERDPYMEDVGWYKRATVCSNNYLASQVETKRFAAAKLMSYGYTVDTLMSDGSWSGGCSMDLSDVITTINSGIGMLNYRGEGWSDGWHANCYYFSTSDVSGLNNGKMMPFVTSIGCGVAMFNGGQCFGEQWIELGTPTAPRGACAFIGPTSNTWAAYNNEIDKGIYTGMFQESIESPGEALLRGKLQMYDVFGGDDPKVEHHFEIYCILGDPSLHIWRNVPREIMVTYPDSIATGYSQVEVNVSNITGAVRNARVTITGPNYFGLAYTDFNGMAFINVNISELTQLAITVTGPNVYPFEGIIQTIPPDENIAPLTTPFVDDLDGNNDGFINPNENCSISFTLKNWGNITSYNVSATLQIPDSIDFVDVTTSGPISFGDISMGDSVQGDPFGFFVHPECPVGYTVPFKLHIESTTNSWDYYSLQPVHGCQLNSTEYQVDDAGNMLHNHRMDPGETVNVTLKVHNEGDDTAPDIKVILQSNDPYITVLDSIGTFDTLLPDSSGRNLADPFIVKVDEDCPLQHEASYTIIFSTQNGLYPYSSSQTFIIPVAEPSHYDPTGPDEYGYYAYSTDDTLWQQAPGFDWIDITANGTLMSRPGSASDFTQTVSLPFTFKYYGNDFTQVRVSSDGWIAFGNGTQTNHENFALPNGDDINNMTAVFWDDLFSTNSGEIGKIYYLSDPSNHRFIISWVNVGHADNYSIRETFEVILNDPDFYPTVTGDGEIIIQYQGIGESGSCSVGIENAGETIGLNYVYDDNYDVTATPLRAQMSIKFTTNPATVVEIKDPANIENHIPDRYSLEQNYPNPFNPATHIRYALPEAGQASIRIYRIDGQLVKILCDDYFSAGTYEKVWDGTNNHGVKVSSGVYLYRLISGNFSQVKKMLFIR